MFFCLQPSQLKQDQSILIKNTHLKVQPTDQSRIDYLEENCPKLIIPQPIVRSSSLSKKTLSNSKENSTYMHPEIHEKQQFKKKNSLKTLYQQQKNKQESNAKNAIFKKLTQKNQKSSKKIVSLKNKQNQQPELRQPSSGFYHKHQNIPKLINLYKQKTQNQLKQCTFNPKTNLKQAVKSFDTEQFFKGQISYNKRTQDKVEEIRLLIEAQKQKQNTFKPKLTDQTSQLTQRRSQIDVYDRLYVQNTQNQDQTSDRNILTLRNDSRGQSSKKSLTLASISKQNSSSHHTSQSKQQNNQKRSTKKFNQITFQLTKQLTKQKSLKNFQNINLLKNYSKKDLTQFPTNNIPIIYETHLLDCRELIKQKQRSNNFLNSKKSQPDNYNNNFSKIKSFANNTQHNEKSIPKISQKNQKIALQKFIKEFFTVCMALRIKNQINYSQMVMLLRNLNFVECQVDVSMRQTRWILHQQTQNKINELWELLDGKQTNEVMCINLLKILAAIHGYQKVEVVDQVIQNIHNQINARNMVLKSDKILIISQKDSKSIKKDFSQFNLTRLKLGQSKLVSKKQNNCEYSFTPSVSKQSEIYADKYRDRIIAQGQKLINQGAIRFQIPQNGLIDHATLLMLDQKIKQYKLQRKRQSTENQKRRQQDQPMIQHSTFRQSNSNNQSQGSHKISKNYEDSSEFSRISHNQSQSRSQEQIFRNLYQRGREHNKSKCKFAEQFTQENKNETLTFKPQINKHYINQNNPRQRLNPHQSIPNFTKQVWRMRKPKNQINDQPISPLLYLNIIMQGNQNTKIPVYQDDSFQSLTQKIRVLMNISNGAQETAKLKKILRQQIIPALKQIGVKNLNNSLMFSQ